MGLAKKFLQFLNKNKIHFSLSPRTLLNNVFNVLFHYLLPFFRQLHNSIFPKLSIFLSKELLQVPFTVFQGIEAFFPLREFCKDWNQWKSEGTISGEYEGWIKNFTAKLQVSACSSKKQAVLCRRWCVFCWLIPDAFCQVLLSVDLLGAALGINCLVFQKELINKSTSFRSHHIHNVTGLWWFVVAHFTCPMISSIPYYIVQYPLITAHHHLF